MEAALQTALHGEQGIGLGSEYLEINNVYAVILDTLFEGASLKETVESH